jgi:UPF0716 protein FxsA
VRLLPLLLLFLLAYIEITLFIKVAALLGVAATLLLVVFTSCIGVSLVRARGVKILQQLQSRLMAGESPAAEMVKSVSLLLAGLLLLIPGFFTDILGLLLLLPVVQRALTLKLLPHVTFFGQSTSKTEHYSSGNTFDGEFERKDEPLLPGKKEDGNSHHHK